MSIKCPNCGFDKENEFVGIFSNGIGFLTTNRDTCGLYGCPKCNTVVFTTDVEYINKRKEMYKNNVK